MPKPTPSMPALLEMTVRSHTPASRTASIKVSGMPHRPKPPAMMVIPSHSNPANAAPHSHILSSSAIPPHQNACLPVRHVQRFSICAGEQVFNCDQVHKILH